MILISVGTQKQNFRRIFELVEKSKELENEEIIALSGYTKYESQRIKMLPLMPDDEVEKLVLQSDIVICHGGVGTIFNALHHKKKVLAIPRLYKYGEHVDDHQIEVCKCLQEEGYILYYMDGEDFDKKIKELKSNNFKEYVSNDDYLQILRKEI